MLVMLSGDLGETPTIEDCENDREPEGGAAISVVLADGGDLVTVAVASSRVQAAVRIASDYYELAARGTRMLGQSLCCDPGFNIILDLFLSTVQGTPLSVTSVCIGSRTAMATALRYISLLGDAGYVRRIADNTDGRRYHVFLTCDGWSTTLDMLSPKVTCSTTEYRHVSNSK